MHSASARSAAVRWSIPSCQIANSSAPTRATTSLGRTMARNCPAMRISTRSPCSRPSARFTPRRSSISTSTSVPTRRIQVKPVDMPVCFVQEPAPVRQSGQPVDPHLAHAAADRHTQQHRHRRRKHVVTHRSTAANRGARHSTSPPGRFGGNGHGHARTGRLSGASTCDGCPGNWLQQDRARHRWSPPRRRPRNRRSAPGAASSLRSSMASPSRSAVSRSCSSTETMEPSYSLRTGTSASPNRTH